MRGVGNIFYPEFLRGFVAVHKGNRIFFGHFNMVIPHGVGNGEQAVRAYHPYTLHHIYFRRIINRSAEDELRSRYPGYARSEKKQ